MTGRVSSSGLMVPKRSLARRLRRYFMTGIIVIAPVGITVYVMWWIFGAADAVLGEPLRGLLGLRVPGLGLLLLFIVITAVGWAVRRAAGRQLLHWWNESLSQFPLTGRIYSALSQVVQSVVGSKQRLFRRTVLIPYPTEGLWAVAFVTNEESLTMSRVVGEPCANVFVPTTPNPTSGFMLIVPVSRVKNVDLSVEDAMKLIISAGALSPGDVPIVGRGGLDLDRLLKDSIG